MVGITTCLWNSLYAAKRRNFFQAKQSKQFKAYLSTIKPSSLNGSFGVGSWSKVHGDTKSSAAGVYRMYSMKTSEGKYVVEIRENNVSVKKLEYDEEPTWDQVGEDVKAMEED